MVNIKLTVQFTVYAEYSLFFSIILTENFKIFNKIFEISPNFFSTHSNFAYLF